MAWCWLAGVGEMAEDLFKTLQPSIKECMQSSRKLIFVGHSLGAPGAHQPCPGSNGKRTCEALLCLHGTSTHQQACEYTAALSHANSLVVRGCQLLQTKGCVVVSWHASGKSRALCRIKWVCV